MEEVGRNARALSGPEHGDIGKPVSPYGDFQLARQHVEKIVLPAVPMLRAVAEFVYGQMVGREGRSAIYLGRQPPNFALRSQCSISEKGFFGKQ